MISCRAWTCGGRLSHLEYDAEVSVAAGVGGSVEAVLRVAGEGDGICAVLGIGEGMQHGQVIPYEGKPEYGSVGRSGWASTVPYRQCVLVSRTTPPLGELPSWRLRALKECSVVSTPARDRL